MSASKFSPETRALLKAELLERVAAGEKVGTVARDMGVPHATAYTWADPDGRRKDIERKRRYDGVCGRCGGRTVGDGRREGPPAHCAACARQIARENRYWTNERCIAAAHKWVELKGRPPTAHEWLANRHLLPEGEWPNYTTIQRYFGRWSDYLIQCGLPARLNWGNHPTWFRPEILAQARVMYEQGMSMVAIAEVFDVTPNAVRLWRDKDWQVKRQYREEAA